MVLVPEKNKQWFLNQRWHAKQRFKQRFGINFNKHYRKKIVDQIQAKELVLLEKQSAFREAYFGYLNNQPIVFVYDTKSKNIVSCLFFEEFLQNYYIRMGNGRARRIRKRVEQVTGQEFTPEQNEEIEVAIHVEFKKLKKLMKNIVEQEVDYEQNKKIN